MVEVESYNIISDHSLDILNHNSIDHIKQYFDRIEHEKSNSERDPFRLHIQNIKTQNDTSYSINSIVFVIKLCIFILFIFIIIDYIKLDT